MTDRELEAAAPGLVRGRGRRRPRPRPVDLRESLAAIPATTPAPLRPLPAGAASRCSPSPRSCRRRRCPGRRFRDPAPDAGGDAGAVPGRRRPGSPSPTGPGPRRRHRPRTSGRAIDRLHPYRRQGPNCSSGRRPSARLPGCGSSERTGTARTSCSPTAWASQTPGLVARRDAPALLRRRQAVPDRAERRPPTAGRHRLRAAVA